jgi:two-component system response regulator YesN
MILLVEAEDGREALRLVNNWSFELVILDLVLPNLNGLNLVDLIRARWPKMPIIVISGYLSESAGKIILEGCAEFIQKPIQPKILVAAVQRLLSAKL